VIAASTAVVASLVGVAAIYTSGPRREIAKVAPQVSAGVKAAMEGRHDEARAIFQRLLRAREDAVGARHPRLVVIRVVAAINESMAGKPERALQILNELPAVAYQQDGQDQETIVAWLRARVFADMGRFDLAAAELRGRQPVNDDQRETLGETACATGHPDEGRALIEELLARGTFQRIGRDPRMADLRAKLGLCALAAGDRSNARELAAAARQSLEKAAAASPYYRLRIERLESALAAPATGR
jgi:hypothetical protein